MSCIECYITTTAAIRDLSISGVQWLRCWTRNAEVWVQIYHQTQQFSIELLSQLLFSSSTYIFWGINERMSFDLKKRHEINIVLIVIMRKVRLSLIKSCMYIRSALALPKYWAIACCNWAAKAVGDCAHSSTCTSNGQAHMHAQLHMCECTACMQETIPFPSPC